MIQPNPFSSILGSYQGSGLARHGCTWPILSTGMPAMQLNPRHAVLPEPSSVVTTKRIFEPNHA
jgi:hypothetical protein